MAGDGAPVRRAILEDGVTKFVSVDLLALMIRHGLRRHSAAVPGNLRQRYDLDAVGLASLREEIGDGNGLFARLDVTAGFVEAIEASPRHGGTRPDVQQRGHAVQGMFDEQSWGRRHEGRRRSA